MKFLTRKLITPADLNPRGTLHGGQLLKWIDEEGGIHAALELQTGLIVTKYISEIDFKFPVLEGDVVEMECKHYQSVKHLVHLHVMSEVYKLTESCVV